MISRGWKKTLLKNYVTNFYLLPFYLHKYNKVLKY